MSNLKNLIIEKLTIPPITGIKTVDVGFRLDTYEFIEALAGEMNVTTQRVITALIDEGITTAKETLKECDVVLVAKE